MMYYSDPCRVRRRPWTIERMIVLACRSQKISGTLLLTIIGIIIFFGNHPLPPPDVPIQKLDSRVNDYEDAFRNFKGRESCNMGGSLEIRKPFEPLCDNSTSLLDSMTSGGRAGFNAPYQPRGCDLHFYDALQICTILTRYETLVVFGDSLMRHLTATFALLIRENLESGGQRQWMKTSTDNDCTCDKQVQLFFCHKTDIMSMSDVYENDPTSLRCPFIERPAIEFRPTVKYPLDANELDVFINTTFAEERPRRPYAIIYGQGLWNDLDSMMTLRWIDQIQDRLFVLRPYMKDAFHPSIFVSPSAAGENKQEGFLLTQGNHAVSRFEKAMRVLVPTRGLDFFGTYNMSIQATVPDGTHSGVAINILKAMTIVNWLDFFDDSEWQRETQLLAAAQASEKASRKAKGYEAGAGRDAFDQVVMMPDEPLRQVL